jgi:hypothetical protein
VLRTTVGLGATFAFRMRSKGISFTETTEFDHREKTMEG